MKKLLALILALAMLIPLAACKKDGEGEQTGTQAKPEEVAAQTENFSVSLAEATYIFNKFYNEFQQQNSEYLSFYGIDRTKSLKDQLYTGETSWFDYFLEQATSYIKEILVFCEAARAEGISLDDEENESIDKIILTIETQATGNGYTIEELVGGMYGEIVDLSVLRSAMQKENLAIKYYNSIVSSFEFTDEQEDAYLAANPDEFYSVDYISYTFKEDNDREAKAKADELSGVTNAEAFTAYVADYGTNVLQKDEAPAAASYVKKGDDEMTKWAFDASVGETYVKSSDVDGVYTVYMLTKAASLQEYPVRSFRCIALATADNTSYAQTLTKANELLEEWKNGDATAESFGELAKNNSSDTSTKYSGGIYSNIGRADTSVPAAVMDWLYAAAQTGETGIVRGDEMYYVLYYEGEGDTQWRAQASVSLGSKAYDEKTAQLAESHPVTLNDDVLSQIDEIKQ